jgi:hypothetical protein
MGSAAIVKAFLALETSGRVGRSRRSFVRNVGPARTHALSGLNLGPPHLPEESLPDWQIIEPWLRDVGKYEHHCFISWPHTQNVDIADCARMVKAKIESRLGESFVSPKVYIDSSLEGGDRWNPALRSALCRSMSMIAICAPVYFRSEHLWCGLEWASMYQLGERRLPNVNYVPIIPLMVRVPDPLPWNAQTIQFIDVSRVTVKGRKYYGTDEFRTKIDLVVKRIEKIAEGLWQNQAVAACDLFQFPTVSAFAAYTASPQSFPLVS